MTRSWAASRRTASNSMRLPASSVHPGCAVVPAVGYDIGASGKAMVEAIVAGYETTIAIARACHPDLRQRDFARTQLVAGHNLHQ